MFEYHELSSREFSQNGSARRSRSLFRVQNCGLIRPSIEAGWNMIGHPFHGDDGSFTTAQLLLRLGFPKSSPVSTTATLIPCPSYPSCQTSYAWCSRATAQLIGDTPPFEAPRMPAGFFSPAKIRAM